MRVAQRWLVATLAVIGCATATSGTAQAAVSGSHRWNDVAHPELCLSLMDPPGGHPYVAAEKCNTTDNDQLWYTADLGNGRYLLESRGGCAYVDEFDSDIAMATCDAGIPNEIWNIVPSGSGYAFSSPYQRDCIALRSSTPDLVWQGSCAETWSIKP